VFAAGPDSILLYPMTASYLAIQNAEKRRAAIDGIEDEDCSPWPLKIAPTRKPVDVQGHMWRMWT